MIAVSGRTFYRSLPLSLTSSSINHLSIFTPPTTRNTGSCTTYANYTYSIMSNSKKQRLSKAFALSSSSPLHIPNIVTTDHLLQVPLDYTGQTPGDITVFFREVVSRHKVDNHDLPYLLYLQGGPGYEAPRPTSSGDPSWLKAALDHFRVILMDQRGTGQSSGITCVNLTSQGTPEQQAHYLTFFRADSIVEDAERVRAALLQANNKDPTNKWTILGQSFGGFCVTTYLSKYPHSLQEALLTGGLPPSITLPCSADTVYDSLIKRAVVQNEKYYSRFPGDEDIVRDIITYIIDEPEGRVVSPAGNYITPRTIQALGLATLGFSGGFERLHYMLATAFDGDKLSFKFKKAFDAHHGFDTNPLYAIMHESIYCQPGGQASNWAAQRRVEKEASFDAVAATKAGKRVLFTGEMVFPWMFEDFAELRKIKEAADIVAQISDWPALYDVSVLNANTVPAAAATYYEDMFVDFNLAQETAGRIKGLRQYITNEFLHDGIRENGPELLEKLLNLCRGGTLLR